MIADHLRATAPVAVMMSGGLDSTAIASSAAAMLRPAGRTTTCALPVVGYYPAPSGWTKPVLERLSMKATETASQAFTNIDGATHYS